jgi:chromate reductase
MSKELGKELGNGHQRRVAVFVGSLRKASWSRAVATSLFTLAPAGLTLGLADIASLPLFNEDLEEFAPASWQRLRDLVKTAHAVLFVTPEYNRSVPAVLKNALDVGSRPYGKNVWDGKPGGVISVSPGAIGGFGANHHLRQSLAYLNVPTMAQPEAYIGGVAGLFDADGMLAQEATRQFLRTYLEAFALWIDSHTHTDLTTITA